MEISKVYEPAGYIIEYQSVDPTSKIMIIGSYSYPEAESTDCHKATTAISATTLHDPNITISQVRS